MRVRERGIGEKRVERSNKEEREDCWFCYEKGKCGGPLIAFNGDEIVTLLFWSDMGVSVLLAEEWDLYLLLCW